MMAADKRKYDLILQTEFHENSTNHRKKSKGKIQTRFLSRWPGDVSNIFQRTTIKDRLKPNLNLFFNQLPDEIILLILSYLNKSSIVSFARTCHRFRAISYHPSLWRRVDISYKRIDAEQLIKLLQRGTSTLKMYQTTLEDSESMTIRSTSLKYLDLTSTILSSDLLYELINSCRSLRKLSLESASLNSAIIEKLVLNEHLDALNLAMCTGLTDESIQILMNKLLSLRCLNISWTNMSLKAVENICQMMPRSIEQLNIGGQRQILNDDHILTLVRRTSRLRNLDISDSALITDQSIVAIRQNARSLVHLSASRCYQLTEPTLSSLKSLPNFSILDIFGTLPLVPLQHLREQLGPRIRLNVYPFSSIARPTIGIQRTSIWGIRTRA